MKKLCKIAFMLLLLGVSLASNAYPVTDIPFIGRGGEVTYEEMQEYIDSDEWGIVLQWTEDPSFRENIYANPDHELYNEEKECIMLQVFIDGEYYNSISTSIYVYSLHFNLGDIWEQVGIDYKGTNFEMDIPIPEGAFFIGEYGKAVNGNENLHYSVLMDGNGKIEEPVYMKESPKKELVSGNIIYIYWEEEIFAVEGGDSVPGKLRVPNSNEEEIVYLDIVTWLPGVTDGIMPDFTNNALKIDLSSFVEKYGEGRYVLNIMEGEVKNIAGEVNDLITFGNNMVPNFHNVTNVTFKGIQGEISYEQMQETINLNGFGPVFYWTDDSSFHQLVYPNKDSEYYNSEKECIMLNVYINEDFYASIGTDIIAEHLHLDLGSIWNKIGEEYKDNNFTLTIPIPQGCFFIGKDGGDINGNETVTFYVLMDGSGNVETVYMTDPKKILDGFVAIIYWEEEIFIMEEDALTVTGQLRVPGQTTQENVQLAVTNWIPEALEGSTPAYNNNALILNLSPYVEKYGEGRYVLNIMPGSVYNEKGEVNDLVTFGNNLVPAMSTVDYIDFSIDTTEIVIVYSEDVEINPENEAEIAIYALDNEDDVYRPGSDKISIDGGKITIDLSSFNLSDDLTYYYDIPEGFFLVGGNFINNFIEGTFNTSSGIEVIGSALENSPVYNLQGVKVANGLEGLNKGIYIVRGKKIAIK